MIAYRAIGVALAVSLLISGPGALAFAADFLGQVVRILDGDTLEVLHNQAPERIGLSGIDCPEKGQLFGKRAKQAASELVFGMEVTLQTHGHDKYGRSLADVLLSDGTNGCCTAPRRSSFQSATYEEGSSFIALIRYRMRSHQKGGSRMSSISPVTSNGTNSAQQVQPNAVVHGKHGKVRKGHHGPQGLKQPSAIANPSATTASQTVGTVVNKTA